MKILFSADWHIKLGQKNVPIDWQKNRYKLLIDTLNSVSCDLQIVGGDIFDRVPTIEELEIFFYFVVGCKVETLLYSGNHEAVGKYTTWLTNLKNVVSKLNKKVTVIDSIYSTPEFDLIPYNALKAWAANYGDYDFDAPILFTHVRGAIPPHVIPEVDLNLFNRWDKVYAGDLHSHSNSQRNIIYPGSPLTTSFHRNEVDTGYLMIDTDEKTETWINLKLPQLLKLTISDPTEMVKTDFHHTMYELHGDMMYLSQVKGGELLDKKVIKTSQEAALILTKDMTVEEELSEYLLYIQGLNENQVKEILLIYHDYITGNAME